MSEITRYQEGPKLSRAVVHGGLVYLCGQVAKDYSGDIKEQTRTMLQRVDEHLAETGSDRSKMLSATIYISDISQATQMNEVWGEWLGGGPRPARTCVEAKLAKPEILVEITVIAAL